MPKAQPKEIPGPDGIMLANIRRVRDPSFKNLHYEKLNSNFDGAESAKAVELVSTACRGSAHIVWAGHAAKTSFSSHRLPMNARRTRRLHAA
jgi:hypothetical protein